MKLYITDESGVNREVKAVWKCSADGKPIKLEEDTPEYLEAVNNAIRQGVAFYGT